MSSSRRHRPSRSNIMFTNAVYFPNYAVYNGDTPAQLNYSCISLVYYAFAKVTEAGHIMLGDEWADATVACDGARGAVGSLLHLKQQHPHLQVVLSVGGNASTPFYPSVAASPVLRDNFARSALGLIEASGLDGIDISWTFPSDPQQAADFVSLLAQIRMHFGEDRYYLTATLPASTNDLAAYDLVQIANCVDLVNLAAYDLYGSWSPRAGHHAQLYAVGKDEPSGASSVQFLMANGMPAKKILVGVPLYGRSFVGPHTTGPGHKFVSVAPEGSDGTFEYRDLPRPQTREHVDKRVVAAQCVGGDGGFVSYDNPDTVRIKATFCKQKSLGGMFYWGAPFDSKDSKRSLIATGFRTLHGS
ncbi:chitinase [Sporothrix schenckii 1099-18]|uniref:chitinase n=2 Tax=Sporothrix schenckii TaxID=29908 RepID=U7PQB1_SPOS1|nr:chitinase [Sporothrix schenckii 1099-18]ERS97828.1 hypothetical protein HMPREF1624_05999 [Sporothrix schenckii ATCC 58251]KJR82391.1 chitinase [Sporothrix schenckii 1099-18]